MRHNKMKKKEKTVMKEQEIKKNLIKISMQKNFLLIFRLRDEEYKL